MTLEKRFVESERALPYLFTSQFPYSPRYQTRDYDKRNHKADIRPILRLFWVRPRPIIYGGKERCTLCLPMCMACAIIEVRGASRCRVCITSRYRVRVVIRGRCRICRACRCRLRRVARCRLRRVARCRLRRVARCGLRRVARCGLRRVARCGLRRVARCRLRRVARCRVGVLCGNRACIINRCRVCDFRPRCRRRQSIRCWWTYTNIRFWCWWYKANEFDEVVVWICSEIACRVSRGP